MILESVVAALVPSAISGIGNLITKWTGGVQAQSIDDVVKLKQADTEQLKAIAALDSPGGTPSQWVVDLRGSFRYIAALVLILAAVACLVIPGLSSFTELAVNLASSAFFFLFGQHVLDNYTNSAAKKK